MKKFVITLSILFLYTSAQPNILNDTLEKVKSAGKSSAEHLCSKDGIKDLCAAYCLGMGITTAHELGHALMGKLLYGAPMIVSVGAMTEFTMPIAHASFGRNQFFLRGFDPSTGFSQIIHSGAKSALKDGIMLAAGPAFGIASSVAAYALLKKYTDKFYLTKAVSLYALFNHTIGIAGLGGVFFPGTDVYKIKELLVR